MQNFFAVSTNFSTFFDNELSLQPWCSAVVIIIPVFISKNDLTLWDFDLKTAK